MLKWENITIVLTTTIISEIPEPNIMNLISLDLLTTTGGDENDHFNDGDDDHVDHDDESNTCRPKPEEKLNEKPAKNKNLEVVERKYHLVIMIMIIMIFIIIVIS